jgi:hypothetical protein
MASVLAAGLAATPRQQPTPPPARAPVATDVPAPMASFTRFLGGRWKMTTAAGKDNYDTWHWGPGKHSIRSTRLGTLTTGEPWSTVSVYYRHPTSHDLRIFSVGSVMRGVGEGRITFHDDGAESIVTLSQTRGPRKLRERWTFTGPDAYHDELSEKVRDDYELLTAWDRHRVALADPSSPAQPAPAPLLAPQAAPSELLRPLEFALGRAWASIASAAASASPSTDEPQTRTTFEYLPHVDAILGRVEVLSPTNTPLHAIDIYLYHHTGTGSLRVLALASLGPDDVAVYEGDITPTTPTTPLTPTTAISPTSATSPTSAYTLRLTGHRPAGTQSLEARVELETPDTVRLQLWTPQGPDRTLIMDRRHQRARN